MLRNMFLKLSKGSQSTASNHNMLAYSNQVEFEEEYIVHQMIKDTNIRNRDSFPSNIVIEEANNHGFFC